MSATLTSTLIAAAIKKAGRSGQSITLTTEFNDILKDMTGRYNILPKSATGSTTADTAYITMPADYNDRRRMILNEDELTWIDPDIYLVWSKTNTDVATIPMEYTVIKEDSKVYFKNKPSSVWTYTFYYWGIHGAVATDEYHTLEDKYEEVIIAGTAFKCCQLLNDWDKAKQWEARYERLLILKAGGNKRLKPVMRSNFWGQIA